MVLNADSDVKSAAADKNKKFEKRKEKGPIGLASSVGGLVSSAGGQASLARQMKPVCQQIKLVQRQIRPAHLVHIYIFFSMT